MVDEEIEQLPTSFRLSLILCCLQGRTRDEAAEALGCSVAAVKSRLERGRDLLRRRLLRRGVQLSAAFLVFGLTTQRIHAALWAKTIQTALHSPTPTIAALAEAGVSAATIGKGQLLLAALLLVSTVAGAVGAYLIARPAELRESPQTKAAQAEKKPDAPPIRRDRHGDPLPEGALARLGTVRWRHGASVHALAYSPDGKSIVTAGVGRALVLWDVATGKELRVFSSRGQPSGLALSPDGKRIATTQWPGQVWDVATGKMLCEFKKLQRWKSVSAVAFAPDRRIVATANDDGVHLWDAADGDEIHRIACGQGRLRAIAYAPDGKLLVFLASKLALNCSCVVC
jgi:hypothetical protein